MPVGPATPQLPFPSHYQRFVISTFTFVEPPSMAVLEGEVGGPAASPQGWAGASDVPRCPLSPPVSPIPCPTTFSGWQCRVFLSQLHNCNEDPTLLFWGVTAPSCGGPQPC